MFFKDRRSNCLSHFIVQHCYMPQHQLRMYSVHDTEWKTIFRHDVYS